MAAHDPVGRLKNGTAEPPRGRAGLSLPERLAVRTISESFRELRDPVAIGRALLDVFDGKDPARPRGRARENPDGLPVEGEVPLDWTHRLAALKMFLEYGYGKALQGIQVQALVEQHHHVHDARPVDLRSLPPEAAAALAVIARAVAGAALGSAQVLAVPRPPQPAVLHEPDHRGADEVDAGDQERVGETDDGGPPAITLDLEEDFEEEAAARHAVNVTFQADPVKGEKETNRRGPGSAL